MASVHITHFSDILCVWAYIGHIRVTELQANFPQEVLFDFRYFNVFGDVRSKMDMQWAERGGTDGYAQHVHEIAAGFDHVNLCLLDAAIRKAFFEAAVDVSRLTELLGIADRQGIEVAELESKLDNGQAHALMANDLKSADTFGISSPTMTFNEGRQALSGNVGYRVLEANIRELIRHPVSQQSWC